MTYRTKKAKVDKNVEKAFLFYFFDFVQQKSKTEKFFVYLILKDRITFKNL